MSASTFFPLPRDQLAGAIVVNAFAILSALALLAFALRIVWLAVLHLLKHKVGEPKEYTFFTTQLGYYAACLLCANMANSIAGLLGLRTLADHGTFQDGYCRGQGFIMQFGNLSTAYFTTAIGVHTFNSLVLRKRQSAIVYTLAIAAGWAIAAILAALPFLIAKPDGEIYGVSGMSCGIRSVYGKMQFLLHLLPIFFTAFVSAVLYALIFLVLRGSLVIRGGVKLQLDPSARWNFRVDDYHRFVAGIAKSMIWYPIAYICLLVPYSVTRLFSLSGFQVPFQAIVFAFTCWFMLGVVNVLLLYNTLRVLSPAFDGRSSTKDPESTGGREIAQEKSAYPFPRAFSPLSPTTTDLSSYGSDRHLLSYPERTASISSYYGYPFAGSPYIANKIAPVALLNETIQMNAAATPTGSVHSRENSAGSFVSLPPPPRTRTPLSSREIVRPPQMSQQRTVSPIRQAGRERTDSAASYSDLDVAGWLAKHNPDGTLAKKNEPLLSAVTPSFPGAVSLSPISAYSTTSPRPLIIPSPTQETPTRHGFI